MVNIIQIDSTLINDQTEYSGQDESLISSFEIDTKFDSTSYIEYNIYDLNNNLLFNDYNYSSYTIKNDGQAALSSELNKIEINLETDLENLGYDQGEYNVYYNILSREIGSNLERLYIQQISSDRTEIRLNSLNLDNTLLIEQTLNFINKREESEYFLDFYINLGDNNLLIANNIIIEDEDPTNSSILIKLYEPLLDIYNLKDTAWIVTSIEDPLAYNVEFIEEPIIVQDFTSLKGPNFNLDLKDQINNSSLNLSYSDIINSNLSSSTNQINSLLNQKELSINIDYSNFSNFIHFSSGKGRLENFSYKVDLIEQYSSSISTIDSNIQGSTSSSLVVGQSKNIFKDKISAIITNFDHYEYFLYYESSSYAWPKSTS